jgi:hypothetical protein
MQNPNQPQVLGSVLHVLKIQDKKCVKIKARNYFQSQQKPFTHTFSENTGHVIVQIQYSHEADRPNPL